MWLVDKLQPLSYEKLNKNQRTKKTNQARKCISGLENEVLEFVRGGARKRGRNGKRRAGVRGSAVVGLHWPSLAAVGLCWLSWAVIGLRGPSLAVVGLRWSLLAIVACVSHRGPALVVCKIIH